MHNTSPLFIKPDDTRISYFLLYFKAVYLCPQTCNLGTPHSYLVVPGFNHGQEVAGHAVA
jgi:hypothetical protein